MATNQKAETVVDPYKPVDIGEHEANMERMRAEQEKQSKTLRKHLNPEFASRSEAKKPLYEWAVSCIVSEKNKKGIWSDKTYKGQVVAQNRDDAWSMFCDSIEHWPGPRDCNREIKQLEKIN